MTSSPGHQKWPDHRIVEEPQPHTVEARMNGALLATSAEVLKVIEDEHPPRYYFPRNGVRMDRLEPSSTTSVCPFKGKATYFNLLTDEGSIGDAVWTYEEPYQEHAALKGRLAFYDEKLPHLKIGPAA